MGSDARLQDLTPAEILHERLMWEIVRRVRDTDHVLKGDCALAFAYSIPRHTADIDFDAKKPTDMMRRIRNGVRTVGAVMTFGERIPSRDALRIRIEYCVRDEDDPVELVVDIRFRPRPVAADVTFVNGIRTYRPEALFKQKLDAFDDRKKPRDLYDLAFLSKKFGDALTDAGVRRSEKITRRINKLETLMSVGPLTPNS